MKLIDLSLPLGPDVQPVVGHPRVRYEPLTTLERDGVNNTLATFSIHTGTHVDAPRHFFQEGKTIDEIPLDRLAGRAWLCDLRDCVQPRKAFTVDDLRAGGLPPGEELQDLILVLYSGWAAEHWDRPDFYTANPYLAEETARWLVHKGIKALALDFGVDSTRPWPNHSILLGKNICLIENLVGLDQILPRRDFTLFALPIKVKDGNGGPARVVALL